MISDDRKLTDDEVLELRRRFTILYETMLLVREYPDFDNGGPLADAIDSALRGELPRCLAFIDDVVQTYGPVQRTT